jgi:hypothetical protein
MAFALFIRARHSLAPPVTGQVIQRRGRLHFTLRTARLHAPESGRSTLGFDPARFQTTPPACYRAPGSYPDRTHTGKRRRAYESAVNQASDQPPITTGRTRTPSSNAGSRPVGANYSTAPSSGTNDTYSTHSANTSSPTTTTGPTKASPTPDHYNHHHRRSPARPRSPASTSADAHV